VAFWRSFFAALSMAAILVFTRRGQVFATVRAVGWPGIVSGAMFCTMFTCFMLAITRTTVANTLVVNSLFPVFAAILGALVLRQAIRAYTWVAIAVAVSGMAWMFANGLGAGLSGTLIAFAIPVAAAVNVVTLRKWGRSVDLAPAVLLGATFSALIALPFARPFESSAHDLAWLAALGMFQLAIPHDLVADRHLPRPRSHFSLLEPQLDVELGVGERRRGVPRGGTLVDRRREMIAFQPKRLGASRGPPLSRYAGGPSGLGRNALYFPSWVSM
jgi:threonine/homoserine efflux transporter RhtA